MVIAILWLVTGALLGALSAYIQVTNNREAWGDTQFAHVVFMSSICAFLGPIAIWFVFFCHMISKR